MNIDLIRILEQGTVTDEHGHVLSGTAKLLYLLHRPISSIQDWEICSKISLHISKHTKEGTVTSSLLLFLSFRNDVNSYIDYAKYAVFVNVGVWM